MFRLSILWFKLDQIFSFGKQLDSILSPLTHSEHQTQLEGNLGNKPMKPNSSVVVKNILLYLKGLTIISINSNTFTNTSICLTVVRIINFGIHEQMYNAWRCQIISPLLFCLLTLLNIFALSQFHCNRSSLSSRMWYMHAYGQGEKKIGS